MHAHQFWWAWPFVFRDKISLKSIIVDQNLLKKFMQVGIDVTCMHNSFGGHSFFSFGDMATFQKRQNFPFRAWTIVHDHQKI